MSLKGRIAADMKSAMKAGEKLRLGTIRLILAAIKQQEVDGRKVLDDQEVVALLQRMVKQRREAMVQFGRGQRDDLVAREREEIAIIQDYLPEALSANEVQRLIDEVVIEVGATSPRDMGSVMKRLRPALQGRADMAAVSAWVKERLST